MRPNARDKVIMKITVVRATAVINTEIHQTGIGRRAAAGQGNITRPSALGSSVGTYGINSGWKGFGTVAIA